jgi:hypothetical protein
MTVVRASSRRSPDFLVLVLSETVLVLERTDITEPIFDHERLDVYRLAIEYVAWSYRIAKSLNGSECHARDQWLLAVQSIPLNIAEGNGKQGLKDKFDFSRSRAVQLWSALRSTI